MIAQLNNHGEILFLTYLFTYFIINSWRNFRPQPAKPSPETIYLHCLEEGLPVFFLKYSTDKYTWYAHSSYILSIPSVSITVI